MPDKSQEAQQKQNHVIFLENVFDELRRRLPVNWKEGSAWKVGFAESGLTIESPDSNQDRPGETSCPSSDTAALRLSKPGLARPSPTLMRGRGAARR